MPGELTARSGRLIGTEFTGLRPGEQVHNVLPIAREFGGRGFHPSISPMGVPPLDPQLVRILRESTIDRRWAHPGWRHVLGACAVEEEPAP